MSATSLLDDGGSTQSIEEDDLNDATLPPGSPLPPPPPPPPVDESEILAQPLNLDVGDGTGPKQRGQVQAFRGTEIARKAYRGKKIPAMKRPYVATSVEASQSSDAESTWKVEELSDTESTDLIELHNDAVAVSHWDDDTLAAVVESEAELRRNNKKSAKTWKSLLEHRYYILKAVSILLHRAHGRTGASPPVVMLEPKDKRWNQHFGHIQTLFDIMRQESSTRSSIPTLTYKEVWRLEHGANALNQRLPHDSARFGDTGSIPKPPRPITGHKANMVYDWSDSSRAPRRTEHRKQPGERRAKSTHPTSTAKSKQPVEREPKSRAKSTDAEAFTEVRPKTAASNPSKQPEDRRERSKQPVESQPKSKPAAKSRVKFDNAAETFTEVRPKTAPRKRSKQPADRRPRSRPVPNSRAKSKRTQNSRLLEGSAEGNPSTVAIHINANKIVGDEVKDTNDRHLLAAGVLPAADLKPTTTDSKGRETPIMNFNGFLWDSNPCYARLSNGNRCGRTAKRMGPFCAVHSDKLLGLKARMEQRNPGEKASKRTAVPNGLIATVDIRKGEVITVIHGEELSTAEARQRYTDDRQNVWQIPYFTWKVRPNLWMDMRQSNCGPARLIRDSHLDIMVPHIKKDMVADVRNGMLTVQSAMEERDRSREGKANCKTRPAKVGHTPVLEIVATDDIPSGSEIIINRGSKWRKVMRQYLADRDRVVYKRRGRGRPGLTRQGQKQSRQERAARQQDDSGVVVARQAEDAERLRQKEHERTKLLRRNVSRLRQQQKSRNAPPAPPAPSGSPVIPPRRRKSPADDIPGLRHRMAEEAQRLKTRLDDTQKQLASLEGQRKKLQRWADKLRSQNASRDEWEAHVHVYREWQQMHRNIAPTAVAPILDKMHERAQLLHALQADKAAASTNISPARALELSKRMKANATRWDALGRQIIDDKIAARRDHPSQLGFLSL